MTQKELKQKMKAECSLSKCKGCPYFLLEENKPTCTHSSNYLLNCRLIYPTLSDDFYESVGA